MILINNFINQWRSLSPIIIFVKGPEIYALTEPVIPNTIKIITI